MSGSSIKPDFGGIQNYFRHNIARVLELIVIITAVFVTMQHNIQLQGDILEKVIKQQEKQSEMLSSLTVTVAELTVKVGEIKADDHRIENQIIRHENECNRKFRDLGHK